METSIFIFLDVTEAIKKKKIQIILTKSYLFPHYLKALTMKQNSKIYLMSQAITICVCIFILNKKEKKQF